MSSKKFYLDNKGFIVKIGLFENEDLIPLEYDENPVPVELLKPKWNGNSWVEGETKKKIAEKLEMFKRQLMSTRSEICRKKCEKIATFEQQIEWLVNGEESEEITNKRTLIQGYRTENKIDKEMGV